MNGSSYGSPSGVPSNLSSYLNGGTILDPWTQQFAAPTAAQAMQTPGLQFAMDAAQRGIERGAASKGTLLTGGTQRDLAAELTGLALQGYGGAYDRSLGQYLLNRENFYNNQDRPYSKLTGTAALGRPSGS